MRTKKKCGIHKDEKSTCSEIADVHPEDIRNPKPWYNCIGRKAFKNEWF